MKKANSFLAVVVFIFFSYTGHAQLRERLITQVTYDAHLAPNSFYQTDSIIYRYSGSRSIDTSWGIIQASDLYILWGGNYNTGLLPFSMARQTWGVNGHIAQDTSWLWDRAAGSFFYSNVKDYSYDSIDSPKTTVAYSWDSVRHSWFLGGPTMRYYDPAHFKATATVQLKWDTAAVKYDTTSRSVITYNGAEQITSSSNLYAFGTNHIGVKYLYSYTSAGLMDSVLTYRWINDSIQWKRQSLSINTYDVNGKVDTLISVGWINDTIRPGSQTLDSYTYDGSGYLSQDIQIMWNGFSWQDQQRTTYTYDSHHNATGHIAESYYGGQWHSATRYRASFDSYDMITSRTTDQWDTTLAAWTPQSNSRMDHYYYETYSPAGIAAILPEGEAQLYPVPAADMMSIDISWHEAQAATLTIYDATGRSVYERAIAEAASYHGYLPSATLQPGIYTLSVKGAKGSITKSFNVMR